MVSLASALAPLLVAAQSAAPEVELADLERWRDHVLPTADELSFDQIPWIPDFAEGMRAAESAGKPLLFWAMNGHPLGCT